MSGPGPGRRAREVDVLVVGAGPAGLATATELARHGAGRVEVLEREAEAGGIPRHSHHTGYGLRDLHRVLSGPAYARERVRRALAAGVGVRTSTTATGWAGDLTLDTTSPAGLERIAARAVVLATGARERPRSARLVPGTRPAGVWTTGMLQQAVYLHGQPVGRRAVVVGAEHVSWSAVVTLHHAGVRVVAMVTEHPRQQSYRAFRLGAGALERFPVLTGTVVTRLLGRPVLEAVEVRRGDGRLELVPADTVVFTGDWIPDHELARAGGLTLDDGTRGPSVDAGLRTSRSGVVAVGNLVHPVETADVVALDGGPAARAVLRHLAGLAPPPGAALRAASPLRWVSPQRIGPDGEGPPRGRVAVWSAETVPRAVVEVHQDGRLLARRTLRRTLLPARPLHLDDAWRAYVDPGGGEVVVSARSS